MTSFEQKVCYFGQPLAMNVKETKQIIEMARSKKLFLMEAVWSRYLISQDF